MLHFKHYKTVLFKLKVFAKYLENEMNLINDQIAQRRLR